MKYIRLYRFLKVLYSGKGTSLGMKNNTRPNRWMELTLGKGPRLINFAAGHDGQHVVMVMDDGSVLFAGTARRGEDGDNSKYIIIIFMTMKFTTCFDVFIYFFYF